jgi:hypothetical protein
MESFSGSQTHMTYGASLTYHFCKAKMEQSPTWSRLAIPTLAVTCILSFASAAPNFFSLVGNRNQIPVEKPWRWFRDLNLEYGPVVFLRMGRTPTIILGSAQAAWDILEKQSLITSGRPRFIMGQEILSNNLRGLMSGYNDFWKRWRKVSLEECFLRTYEFQANC